MYHIMTTVREKAKKRKQTVKDRGYRNNGRLIASSSGCLTIFVAAISERYSDNRHKRHTLGNMTSPCHTHEDLEPASQKRDWDKIFWRIKALRIKSLPGSGITADDVVLEIGAGLGSLTLPLARVARKVYAIEKDSALIPPLNNELLASAIDNVILINDNILTLDIAGNCPHRAAAPGGYGKYSLQYLVPDSGPVNDGQTAS